MRNRTWRIIGAPFVIVILFAALLSACGDDDDTVQPAEDEPTTTAAGDAPTDDAWAEIVAAAEEEGEVVLYSIEHPAMMDPVIAEFRRAYPNIDATVVRGTSGDLIPRIEAERDSGTAGADVFIGTVVSWFEDKDLLELTGPAASEWPSDFWAIDGTTPILTVQGLTSIAYNTNLVDTPPTSHEDLLSEEYQGRLAVMELATSTNAAMFNHVETELADEGYFEDLGAMDPQIYPGMVPMMQAVGSGEAIAAPFATISGMEDLKASGAPVDYVVPSPVLGTPFPAAALGWADHPNAALVLMDFFMSEQGQGAWHSEGWSVSPLGVEGAQSPDDMVLIDHSQYPEDVLNEWKARFEQHYR